MRGLCICSHFTDVQVVATILSVVARKLNALSNDSQMIKDKNTNKERAKWPLI